MILANCRCHTALSAFSMSNEASLDHNWHSWKIRGQTCFPIIFNCQTFCTNKCCLHLAEQESSGWLRRASFMTSFEAIRAWGRVVAETLLSVADLKSPSAQTAGLIVTLPSSLWFGLRRKSRLLIWLRVTHGAETLMDTSCTHYNARADKERFPRLTGVSVQLQKHRQRQTQTHEDTHRQADTHTACTPVHVSADRNKGERASLPGMNN